MKYTTTEVLQLPAGVALGLTDAQAAARKHVLQPVPARKGWYTATAQVQFKRGEQFLHDGDLPKHLANGVETPEEEKSRKAKAKADADAAAKAKAEAEVAAAAQAKADAEAAALLAAGGKAPDGAQPPAGA